MLAIKKFIICVLVIILAIGIGLLNLGIIIFFENLSLVPIVLLVTLVVIIEISSILCKKLGWTQSTSILIGILLMLLILAISFMGGYLYMLGGMDPYGRR